MSEWKLATRGTCTGTCVLPTDVIYLYVKFTVCKCPLHLVPSMIAEIVCQDMWWCVIVHVILWRLR